VSFDRLGETGYAPERTLREGVRELAANLTGETEGHGAHR
jgi:hypothetical protein